MNKSYPMVKLEQVLNQYKEYIEKPEAKIYPKLSVKLYGKGVVLDEPANGASLKMKRHQLAKAGQVILSEIWGKKGAIGFVPPEGEGALCTSHFFLFDVNEEKILPKYLQAIFTANYLETQLDAEAKGTTGYAAVRPRILLSSIIPLPPLEEQRRLVARIEELAVKVEEARGLRREAMEELKRFSTISKLDLFQQAIQKWGESSLSEAINVNMGQSPPGDSYNKIEQGFPLLNGPTEFGETHPTAVQWTTEPTKFCKKNDILLCVRGATVGRMNWADKEYCIGRGLAALTANIEICMPEYAYYFVETQTQEMLALSAGSTFPNLPSEKLKQMKIPIPPLKEQYRIVEYLNDLQAKVETVKKLQADTEAELEALLPAILEKAFRGEL